MTSPPLAQLLDPTLQAAVAALHARQHHTAPEQALQWQPLEGNRSAAWLVDLAAGRAVASARLEAHFSRRHLGCLVRSQRGPVAESVPALVNHLARLREQLADMADEIFVQPQVPHATSDELEAACRPLGFEQVSGVGSPSATLLVDLQLSLADILASFRPAVRRQIRSIQRRGLTCRLASDARSLTELVSGYNRFAGTRQLPTLDPRVLGRMVGQPSQTLALPFMVPVAAYKGGALVGGAFFFVCGRRLVYQWGFIERTAAGPLPITHACFWHAIETVHGRGVIEFDLGGYWPDRGTDDPINRFKLGFSARQALYGPKLHYQGPRRLRWVALLPGSAPRWP